MNDENKRSKYNHGIWFIVPSLLFLIVLTVIPLLYSVYLSLNSGKGQNYKYVGIDNYINLLNDATFSVVLKNSILFTLIIVPLIFFISIVVCILLNELKSKSLRSLFVTLLYLPCITSPVVYSLFFKQLAYRDGILSNILSNSGFFSSDFNLFQNEWASRIYIALICVWAWSGFYIVIINSAIQNIEPEIIKAAKIDGSSMWTIYNKIIFPQINNVLLLVVLLTICSTFQIYVEVSLITEGGPGFSTYTLGLYLQRRSFKYVANYGYSSALGIIIFTVNAIFSLAVYYIRSKNES